MNKFEAIEWCKEAMGGFWPKSTKYASPPGWVWVVRSLPYQLPEYYLLNEETNEEIHIADINI